jgi:uncharacterized protein YciI
MPLFILSCFDRPGGLERRMAAREDHLAWVRAPERASMVRLAGPYLDDAGQMIGSMFILEAPDRAAVEAFSAADPYTQAGLFSAVEIRGWRVTIGELP